MVMHWLATVFILNVWYKCYLVYLFIYYYYTFGGCGHLRIAEASGLHAWLS